MDNIKAYKNFPVRIIVLSNLVSILVYFSGLIIITRTGWIPAAVFLLFILALEYRLLSSHCVNCYYWGRRCGFGKGRLSSLFFKKGDPSKFCGKEMKWQDMIPDILVSLVPLIIGIVLMIIRFDFIILFTLILLIGLSTSGTAFIRNKLTCRYCRQREIECPAEKLFRKE